MRKIILLLILAFGFAFSQGFETSGGVLYVQDGNGTVSLTPLQGAYIVTDSSARAALADANDPTMNLGDDDYECEIGFNLNGITSTTGRLISKSIAAGGAFRAYVTFVGAALQFYSTNGSSAVSDIFYADITQFNTGWQVVKFGMRGRNGSTMTKYLEVVGQTEETASVTDEDYNSNFDFQLFAYQDGSGLNTNTNILNGVSISYVKITKAGTLQNYFIPTPNTDSDRNTTVLLDIVGSNHATWTGATLADIADRSNAVVAPENDMGYNPEYYFDSDDDNININSANGVLPDGAEQQIITLNAVLFAKGGIENLFVEGSQSNGQKISLQYATNVIALSFYGHSVSFGDIDLFTAYEFKIIVPAGASTTDDVQLWIDGVQKSGSLLSGETRTLDVVLGGNQTTIGADVNSWHGVVYDCEIKDASNVIVGSWQGSTGWIDESSNSYDGVITGAYSFPIPANLSTPTVDAFGVALGSNAGVIKRPGQVTAGDTTAFENRAYIMATDSIVISFNPYDLKEINDSYAAGSNSWGVTSYEYGDTLDGVYFLNTATATKESDFYIYDTDGTTILGKYLYETGGYGNQRTPRLWRTIRTPR